MKFPYGLADFYQIITQTVVVRHMVKCFSNLIRSMSGFLCYISASN